MMFISLSLFDPQSTQLNNWLINVNLITVCVHQTQTKINMASRGGKGRIPMFRACALQGCQYDGGGRDVQWIPYI